MTEPRADAPADDDALWQRQFELQREAAAVRADLDLDALCGSLGQPHLVGSAALGLMVWRDLDITVVCSHLDVAAVFDLGRQLASHARVRALQFRNDTGAWNVDPTYPDGVYWAIDYRDADRRWNIDMWFVDEPARQPDLAHLEVLQPRLDDNARRAILAIKDAWAGRPQYRKTVTSYDIYTAVLDDGVRSPSEFEAHLRRRR